MAIAFSDDGYHFEAPITIKTAYDCAPDIYYVRADTQNQLFWSRELERYVVITRGYAKRNTAARVVAYMESTSDLKSVRDLLKLKLDGGEKYWEKTAAYWTCPEMVLDKNVTIDAQPYSMPISHLADGCYIGILSVANFDRNGKGVWNSVHAELTYSNNAREWQYVDKGNQFIKNAEHFALESGNDYGMIYCAAPVNVGDKTEIFYAATPELHYTEYSHIPENIRRVVDEKIPKAKEIEAPTRTTTLSVARISKDRYAGFWAYDGSITTEAFEISGDELKITADVSDNGALSVEVLDSDGRVTDGYGSQDFEVLYRSATDRCVCWGGRNLALLKGKTVYFKIYLKNAGIYTIGGNIEFSSQV